VGTDEEDRPVKPVLFMKAEVFVDPFEEAAKVVSKEREAVAKGAQKGWSEALPAFLSSSFFTEKAMAPQEQQQKPKAYTAGVGKYIKPDIKKAIRRVAADKVGLVEINFIF
jgi:hypothetical protein